MPVSFRFEFNPPRGTALLDRSGYGMTSSLAEALPLMVPQECPLV
jgi:hypothetical protein